MPYRILHSIASVNPHGGGPIEGLKQLAVLNQRYGHIVEVVSLDAPDDPWVEGCPVRCHALGPAYSSFRYSPRLVPWLRAHHREYDCIVVNGIWQYNAFGVWRVLKDQPTPYFVYPHGMLDPWFRRRYPWKHLKKWLYWPWGDFRTLRDARAVLFTCEEERRLARRSFWLYRCDEFVVSYGTSGPSGDPETQRAAFVEKFPETAGKRNLLFLGRVHEKKGADLFIQAFAQLLEETSTEQSADWHVVMAGPQDHSYGVEMQRLVERLGLKKRVTWTGMVTGDLKWGAFYQADAFVLPSHQENFGIAVVEALACRVPVLISNQVNIWREIQMDQAGIVDSDTIEGTKRMMEHWLNLDQESREKMRRNAESTFAHRFHISTAAASFIHALAMFGVKGSITAFPLDDFGNPLREERRRPGLWGRRKTDRPPLFS